jgi:IS4 transposase
MHSLDSGFHFFDSGVLSLDSGFRSLDSGFHYLDSGFQIGRGFRIPENWPRIRILDSCNVWILDDVWILDSTFWIPDCKVIKS